VYPPLTYNRLAAADNLACLMLGTAAVAATATLWLPWGLAVSAAAVVLSLSFLENERFFLALIFLQPIDIVSSAIPFVSDASLGLHVLAVAGFFLGRLYRGQLQIGKLLRAGGARTSLIFVAAIALSAICGLPGLAHEKVRGVYFVAVYFGFYLFLMSWLVTEERRRSALRALLYSTLLVGVFAIIQFVSHAYTPLYTHMYDLVTTEWKQRPPSFLPGPNALAGYLNLILPLAIAGFVLSKERGWKRLSGAVAAIGILSLVLTQSRGGYIAFAITVVFAIWHFGRTRKRRIALLLALALLGTGSYAALRQWNPGHFGDLEDDHSALTRVILWYAAWNLFLSSPVHGIGFGTFTFISDQYLPVVADMPEGLGVHNIYLELLAESGVLGLSSFLVVAVSGIRRAQLLGHSANWFQHAIGFGAAGGMTAMLVGGFVDHNVLWAPQIGLLFWFWLAMVGSRTPHRGTEIV
jgi:putative inorganic carbon (hco3(-)) transporter